MTTSEPSSASEQKIPDAKAEPVAPVAEQHEGEPVVVGIVIVLLLLIAVLACFTDGFEQLRQKREAAWKHFQTENMTKRLISQKAELSKNGYAWRHIWPKRIESRYVRDPEVVSRTGNRLVDEKSAFLKGYSRSPVDWLSWKDAPLAFQRARTEDKPVFLSIGSSFCDTCKKNFKTIFSRNDVAAWLNSHLITIKVDRTESPEIAYFFDELARLLLKRTPQNVLVMLLPDGNPYWLGGDTELQSFWHMIHLLRNAYYQQRKKMQKHSRYLVSTYQKKKQWPLDSGQLSEKEKLHLQGKNVLQRITKRLVWRLDTRWGGLKSQGSYRAVPLECLFLLRRYQETKDTKIKKVLEKNLDLMVSGALYDHIGGGFFETPLNAEWTRVRTYKTLTTNAFLALAYLEAFALFKKPRYRQIASETLDVLMSELQNEQGGFYYGLSANSSNGTPYYPWSRYDFLQLAGAKKGALLAQLFGFPKKAELHQKQILTRRISFVTLQKQSKSTSQDLQSLLDTYLPVLRKMRSKRLPPSKDRKIRLANSGLMLWVLSRAYQILKLPHYLEAANKTKQAIWGFHRSPKGHFFRNVYKGHGRQAALLADMTFLSYGLLMHYMASKNKDSLTNALTILDTAQAEFTGAGELWFMHKNKKIPLTGSVFAPEDGVIPSGNSMMLQALSLAATLSKRPEVHRRVERALLRMFPTFEQRGLQVLWGVDVLSRLSKDPAHSP